MLLDAFFISVLVLYGVIWLMILIHRALRKEFSRYHSLRVS